MIGTLFATLLVKIPAIDSCDGGHFHMNIEDIMQEKIEKEEYYGYPNKARTIRFLRGKKDLFVSPIRSGSISYLEFDVFWRPKHVVSCISLSYFSNYVNLIKNVLENSEENILVFPLRKWRDSQNTATDIGTISSWSENDRILASLLLSISSLYVDLAVVKYDAENKDSYLTYRVEITVPIAHSIPHPSVKDLRLKFPSHFVGANSKWALDESIGTKYLVFVISSRR